MSFSKLLSIIGDGNLKIQRLSDCLREAKTNKKGETNITFGTDVIHTNDLMYGGEKTPYVGVIVWLPTHLIEPARAELKKQS